METVQSKMDDHVLTKLYPPPSPSDMAGWITPQKTLSNKRFKWG